MSVRILRIAPSDRSLFSRIAPDVFDEPIVEGRLQAYLADPSHLLVLAIEDDAKGQLVVGQCAAVIHRHPDKPDELYVDELGTASTHRRQGIGRRLMKEILAWGLEAGCEEGWLGTEVDNVPANGLYRNLFEEGETFVLYEFDLEDSDDGLERRDGGKGT